MSFFSILLHVAWNGGSHVIAGIIFAYILSTFLTLEKGQFRVFILLPTIFAAIFPDLAHTANAIYLSRSIDDFFHYWLTFTEAHKLFHTTPLVLLAVPATLILVVFLKSWFLNKKDDLEKWILIVAALSLFSVLSHILMDSIGF